MVWKYNPVIDRIDTEQIFIWWHTSRKMSPSFYSTLVNVLRPKLFYQHVCKYELRLVLYSRINWKLLNTVSFIWITFSTWIWLIFTKFYLCASCRVSVEETFRSKAVALLLWLPVGILGSQVSNVTKISCCGEGAKQGPEQEHPFCWQCTDASDSKYFLSALTSELRWLQDLFFHLPQQIHSPH